MAFTDLLQKLEVPQTRAIDGSKSRRCLDNDNLHPLRLSERTWGVWTYAMFWFSEASSVSDWFAASAGVTAGLSPVDTVLTLFGGRCVAAILIALNGRGGAMYHIPFPSLVRSSFGVYGSMWPVLSRVVLSCVYQGINLVQGGTCVYVALHAMFPSISRLPNKLPKGAGIGTGGLIGVLILWVVFFALINVPVPKTKIMVHIKVVVFVASAIAMLAWCCTLAGGARSLLTTASRVGGSKRDWLRIQFFFIGLSSCATFTTDAADFQRYAKRPNDVLIGQLIGGPAANLIVHLVGVVVAASSNAIFGELIWNPVLLLDRIQSDNYSSGNRALCFFIALAFSYSSLVTMILGNILPAANDLTGLIPRYVTYRRAAYIVAVIALAMNPWWILGSASIFTAYLSSFGLFYASIIGVMIVDYYIIKRGHLDIPSLFQSDKKGPYYFYKGINIRAYIAYFCGIVPMMPGFAGAVGREVPQSVFKMYRFAFLIGLVLSSSIYFALCCIWPIPQQVPLRQRLWKEPGNYVEGDEVDSRAETDAEECLGVTQGVSISPKSKCDS